jgi:hypothetical protein
MHYIGIDPGVHWSAFAVMDPDHRTVNITRIPSAGLATTLSSALERFSGSGSVTALVEGQRHYPGVKSSIPNDLIDLANVAGRLAGALEISGIPVSIVKPQMWKGAVPKEIHNQRVEARILKDGYTIDWTGILKSERNHYWDAIGMAFYLLDGKTISSRGTK